MCSSDLVHDAARRHGSALDEVLGEANNKIAAASAGMAQEGGDLMFVTAFAGVLDLASGDVVFASAGHDAPFLVRPGAAPRRLDTAGGPPLGVVEEFRFPLDRDRMAVGEVLVLYTDGVTEAMNGARTLYGTERLTAVLAATSADNARSVIEVVTDDVRAFAAGAGRRHRPPGVPPHRIGARLKQPDRSALTRPIELDPISRL